MQWGVQLGERTYENNHYLNLPLSLFSVLQNTTLVTEQEKKISPKAGVIVLFLLVKCFLEVVTYMFASK